MKTFYLPVKLTAKRLFHIARLTFLSAASIIFISNPGISQDNNSEASSSAANANYHRISALTTGPAVKYNITQFVSNVLPTDVILYSNSSAYQIHSMSVSQLEASELLAMRAREIMSMIKNTQTKASATRLSKKVDSLDNNAVGKKFESSLSLIRADQLQFAANTEQVKAWQKKVNGNSDVLTSAGLLIADADNYYSLALTDMQKSDTSIHMYVKQGFMEAAQKNMQSAIIKQQCAENIYISLDPNTAIAIAEKIDSILSVPSLPVSKSEPITLH